jgi:hypothetical protein
MMYDFYNNPPKNVEEISTYLRSWLQRVDDGPVKTFKDQTWVQHYGFRRAFQIHGVYVNTITNQHLFHVDECDWNSDTQEPNFGVWDDFDNMIAGVSMEYAKLWKL